jgi:hypothetical protein
MTCRPHVLGVDIEYEIYGMTGARVLDIEERI